MSDLEILESIKADYDYTLYDGQCISISFHRDSYLFGGTLRRHPHKLEILDKICNFNSLRHINLRKCKLRHLPQFTTTSLEYADLSCNDLTELPTWLLKQPLKHLNLGANKLNRIPDLSRLPLNVLKLHKNPLQTLEGLGDQLTSVNLMLTNVHNYDGLKRCPLSTLTLGPIDFKKLPSLNKWPNLNCLTLSCGNIGHLPDEICSLESLRILQLPKNNITSLPAHFGKLNITALTLYNNQISKLPSSFYDLRLNRLNLACNPLNCADKVSSTFNGIEYLRM